MRTVRRIAHAGLAAVGVVLWLLLALGALSLVGLAVVGYKVWPDADRGNCWTYALPRWALQGGALRVSMIRVGALRIPHAAWVRPDGGVEQTEPVRRASTMRQAWGGLLTLYFRFRVRRSAR